MNGTIPMVCSNPIFYVCFWMYFTVFSINPGLSVSGECGVPGIPQNGEFNLDEEMDIFQPGTVVTYRCQNDTRLLRLHGDQHRTCLMSGKWNGSVPFCEENIAYQKEVRVPETASSVAMVTDGITNCTNPKDCFNLANKKTQYIDVILKYIYFITEIRVYGLRENWFESLKGDEILVSSGAWCSRNSTEKNVVIYKCYLEQWNTTDFYSSYIRFQHSSRNSYWICEMEIFGNFIEITNHNDEKTTQHVPEQDAEYSTEQFTGQSTEYVTMRITEPIVQRNIRQSTHEPVAVIEEDEIFQRSTVNGALGIDESKVIELISNTKTELIIITSVVVFSIFFTAGLCWIGILLRRRQRRKRKHKQEKDNWCGFKEIPDADFKSEYEQADGEIAENRYEESPYLRPRSFLYTSFQHIYESIPADLHLEYETIQLLDENTNQNMGADLLNSHPVNSVNNEAHGGLLKMATDLYRK